MSSAEIKKEMTNNIIKYLEINKQIKSLEEDKNEVRNKIAGQMHDLEVNELFIDIDDETIKCAYQKTTRDSVDYARLLELVGPHIYSEVVTKKTTTTLIIRKAAEKSLTSKVHKAPVDKDDKNKRPPTGILA